MKEKLFFSRAGMDQIDEAMEIIEQGRAYLKSQGLKQWQTGYPDRESIRADLENGKGYFVTDGERMLAYLCMDFDGEPAYCEIKGQWLTPQDAEYMVIHRLAMSRAVRGQGLSAKVFQLAEEYCIQRGAGSIRVDTDTENQVMQAILKREGYTFCGTIWFAGGDKIAFEKVLGRDS